MDDYLESAQPITESPLIRWASLDNVANELSEETLARLGSRVVTEFEEDKNSRADWEDRMASAVKVAKQVKEEKSFPWPKAANVRHPLLAVAAMQFAARVYPEIVQGTRIVNGQVIGADPDEQKQERADRIGEYMSYQILNDMDGWEDDTDTLLHVLPIYGVCWRKVWWDSITNKPCAEFYTPDSVVWNYWSRRGRMPLRLTHILPDVTRNILIERQRAGLWREIELGQPSDEHRPSDDTVACYTVLECHCWADLDEDGYAEPWVITVHQDSRQVLRIAPRFDLDGVHVNDDGQIARIVPTNNWVKYGLIPPPDGSDYDIGFGMLLNPIGESISTLINQLIDAGTMSNTGGGFIARGARMTGGPLSFRPNEWKPIDTAGSVLRDSIVPLPVREPSNVLFQLLELLLETGKQLTTVSDELTGQKTSPNEPATSVIARIEQGMKVFSAIQRRIHRSLSEEFRLLFHLNSLYLDPQNYSQVLDQPISPADFDESQFDVQPTADPNIASDMQRLARSQAIFQTVAQCGGNVLGAGRDILEAMRLEEDEIDEYLPEGPSQREQLLMSQLQQGQQVIQLLQQDLGEAEKKLNEKEIENQLKQKELQLKEVETVHKMRLDEQKQQTALIPTDDSIERAKLEIELRKNDQLFDIQMIDRLEQLKELSLIEEQKEADEMDRQRLDQIEGVLEQVLQAIQSINQKITDGRVIGIKQVRDEKGKLIGGKRMLANGSEEDIAIH